MKYSNKRPELWSRPHPHSATLLQCREGEWSRRYPVPPRRRTRIRRGWGVPRRRPHQARKRPAPRGIEALCPFGKNQGQPLAALIDKDLQWLQGALQTSISDPSKAKYAAKNQKDLAAVTAELRARFL